MSDLGTFVTEYWIPAATGTPGITELRRFAGPFIKADGFDEAISIASRLSIEPNRCGVSVVGQLCDGEVRPDPVAYAPRAAGGSHGD